MLISPLTYASTIDDEVKTNIESTAGVITFLTSQESVSGGLYSLGAPDNPSSNFSTLKLPYRHNYKRHSNGEQWSMLLGYGRFDMKQTYDSEQASSSWQADNFSAGIGYSNWFDSQTRWFASLELAYTSIYHHYKLSQLQTFTSSSETQDFGKIKFNWHTDTVSVIHSAGLRIPISNKLQGWFYQPKLTFIWTESIFEEHAIERVSASSSLMVNRLNFGEIWTFDFAEWGVAINPQINRTDAFGSVGEGLQTSHWYEANLNFRLKAFKDTWWNNLEYGFSLLKGEHFNGGQLTIGISLDQLL